MGWTEPWIAKGQTTVGGQLPPSAVWTAEQSPYHVVQNPEVPAGGTLAIEPGVVARFQNSALIVRGTLVARGTPEMPILLASIRGDGSAPGDWGPIRFESTSPAAQLGAQDAYQGGSVLQHTTIEFGQGVHLRSASPLLEHCTLRYHHRPLGGAIYAEGSRGIIRHCQIRYNTADDHGGAIRAAASELSILHNAITHNSVAGSGGGISIDFSPALIGGNTIAHNYAMRGDGGGFAPVVRPDLLYLPHVPHAAFWQRPAVVRRTFGWHRGGT